MICKKEHRGLEEWDDLKPSQADADGRHICVGCAYNKGSEDASNGIAKNSANIKNLPYSQAKNGRHKNAYQAYDLGYEMYKKHNT